MVDINKDKVVAMTTIMFIGARLFASSKETIKETCQKFNAIKLPIIIHKPNGSRYWKCEKC